MSDVKRWAVVEDGTVKNVILWDGSQSTWTPPRGAQMILESSAREQNIPFWYEEEDTE